MSREVRFEQRMSDAEGLMWRLERDPAFSSIVASVTILDRPVDFDRLCRRMERTSIAVPRLRQRVQPSPLGSLSPPAWVDDVHFAISRHVLQVSLPKPGTLRQLLDRAATLAAVPFDPLHPLWQFICVDGLRGGKGALIQKLHHTIADGEGLIRLSLQFLDLSADAVEPEPLHWQPTPPPPPPTPQERIHALLGQAVQHQVAAVRKIGELIADPGKLPAIGEQLGAAAKGIVRQLTDTDPARSPLWTQRSSARHIEVLRVPLDPMKAAAKKLGGSLNTAFLTVAADAAGAYHRSLDTPADELRASMAISTRSAEQDGSNAFALARFLVPTAEMPLAERFDRIRHVAEAARSQSSGVGWQQLTGVANALPLPVLLAVARSQAQGVDFATSNVRAAPFPVFIAGSNVLQNHPVGPLLGVAFNLTVMSYNGSLDMGLHVDPAAVKDPVLLRKCLNQAFARMSRRA